MNPGSGFCGHLGNLRVLGLLHHLIRWSCQKLEQKWFEKIKHKIGSCPKKHDN